MRRNVLPFVLPLILILTACSPKASTWQEQYDLGVRYLSDGNYEEAIIAFTAAIEIDPNTPDIYMNRANAYCGRGGDAENLSLAEADYLAALELDERIAEAYEKLADVYLLMDMPEKAVAILRQGMDALGDDALFDKRVESILVDASSIQITDIQCSGQLSAGNTVALRVTVEYKCPTNQNVVLYAGSNSSEAGRYELTNAEFFPSENSGAYTFTFSAEVPAWGLEAYVNMSEYPHADSWKPLTHAIQAV